MTTLDYSFGKRDLPTWMKWTLVALIAYPLVPVLHLNATLLAAFVTLGAPPSPMNHHIFFGSAPGRFCASTMSFLFGSWPFVSLGSLAAINFVAARSSARATAIAAASIVGVNLFAVGLVAWDPLGAGHWVLD
jgi:hypothetical protein